MDRWVVISSLIGGYLALTLPLVATLALVPTRLDFRRRERWTRLGFGAGAAVMGF